MPFPEIKLIDKLLAKIDYWIFNYFGWGFCTECHKWTFNLHNSTDQGWHCYSCCKEKEMLKYFLKYSNSVEKEE